MLLNILSVYSLLFKHEGTNLYMLKRSDGTVGGTTDTALASNLYLKNAKTHNSFNIIDGNGMYLEDTDGVLTFKPANFQQEQIWQLKPAPSGYFIYGLNTIISYKFGTFVTIDMRGKQKDDLFVVMNNEGKSAFNGEKDKYLDKDSYLLNGLAEVEDNGKFHRRIKPGSYFKDRINDKMNERRMSLVGEMAREGVLV